MVNLDGGKRTKFKTFHDQMSEMTVPRIHLGFDNGSVPIVTDEADVDLATSHFGTVLLKWRDLNLSENFGNIMRREEHKIQYCLHVFRPLAMAYLR